MLNLIGWLGNALLACCSLPQAYLCWKTKSSTGISSIFVGMWFSGELLTFIYVVPQGRWPLILNYSCNILVLLVILYYKFNESRKPSKAEDVLTQWFDDQTDEEVKALRRSKSTLNNKWWI